MQDLILFFSDYFHSQLNEMIDTITDIRNASFYNYFFIFVYVLGVMKGKFDTIITANRHHQLLY